MKHYSIRRVLPFFILIFTVSISTALGEESASEKFSSPKTLERRFDPVVVSGDLLPQLHGLQIEGLRLFAHDGKHFKVIPFQVDERDPEGEFVYTEGKLVGSDVDNGLFDYNDELVFMVKDTGGQVPRIKWAEMGNTGTEIVITDPHDSARKGWVYLIHFRQNPPPLSAIDYVSYSPEKEIIQSTHYIMRYRGGAPFYMDLSYPEEAGGNGEDFFDRIKIRIKVKTFFNLISITKTEEDLRAEVVGWKDGPVRVLRNVQNFFRILFNLAEPSLFSVVEYYA